MWRKRGHKGVPKYVSLLKDKSLSKIDSDYKKGQSGQESFVYGKETWKMVL